VLILDENRKVRVTERDKELGDFTFQEVDNEGEVGVYDEFSSRDEQPIRASPIHETVVLPSPINEFTNVEPVSTPVASPNSLIQPF
jgi:hypothetical protein